MRKKIVAGNWKMNNDLAQSIDLANKIADLIKQNGVKETIILFPSFIALSEVAKVANTENFCCGAQNVHPQKSGAYTGEIAIPMLQSVGVKYVLVGHSERREYFNETDDFLKQKINALLDAGLTPIFCCGESLQLRNQQQYFNFIEQQLNNSLFHLTEKEIAKVVIAYEPIWAIGTGLTASPTQAQEVHLFIRQCIAKKYNAATANSISILYGGSCKPDNAKQIFREPDIDGGLIGGASLLADDFFKIIKSF
jgi:triosephosphate isomerase